MMMKALREEAVGKLIIAEQLSTGLHALVETLGVSRHVIVPNT